MQEIIDLSDKTITFTRNEYLKVCGSVDTNVYFIESGSVRVFIHDDENEQIIRFGYKGNLIVALDSYLTGKPSEMCIQAIRRTVVRVISKDQVQEFLQSQGSQHLWIQNLEDLVLQQMERETDLLTSSPKERYLRVLKRSPQLFQEVPDRYIANYLRMSPETLSRLKKS